MFLFFALKLNFVYGGAAKRIFTEMKCCFPMIPHEDRIQKKCLKTSNVCISLNLAGGGLVFTPSFSLREELAESKIKQTGRVIVDCSSPKPILVFFRINDNMPRYCSQRHSTGFQGSCFSQGAFEIKQALCS